jgi:uncharacterized membrane protein YedE/YeeE
MSTQLSTPGNKITYSHKSSKISLLNGVITLSILTVFTLYIFRNVSLQKAALLVLGIALGVTLYWATFSFSNGWKHALTERKTLWLRTQMLMLVVASVLMLPIIAKGSMFGNNVTAFVRPIGISLICGAFMFGAGMQVAGSCASGSLYHMGGGRLKMLIILSFFAAGALLATAHYTWWMEKPNFAPLAWLNYTGAFGAILINSVIAGLVYIIALNLEKKRHHKVESMLSESSTTSPGRILLFGAIALAILNAITLVLAGRPWSVASAFPFWGAKASQTIGIELDLDFWDYWSTPAMETMLAGGLLESSTSIMNIGIILGALGIAVSLKRYTFSWRVPWRDALGAIFGGLLLGYGSTIAFGCNIGGFFGGVVSGSLHGWVWFIAAFTGTAVGILLQPWFVQNPTA